MATAAKNIKPFIYQVITVGLTDKGLPAVTGKSNEADTQLTNGAVQCHTANIHTAHVIDESLRRIQ